MRRREQSSLVPPDWPPALRWIVKAAERECPRGHASALRELTTLAWHKVPSRGIFDPGAKGEDELFAAIEAVARRHLELTDARTAWRAAIEAAHLNLDRRDELERTSLQVQSVSDTAYFYAGLAFALAFVYISHSA
jgi:hypothetical protein